MKYLTQTFQKLNSAKAALFLPVILSFTVIANPVFAQEVRPSRVLTVTGRGDRPVQTDKAQVQLGIDVDAKTAGEAQDAIARKANSLISKLQELQVEKLQTTRITLNPKYEYTNNRQVQVGFTAQSSVVFRIGLDKAGQVLDAAVAAGANRIDQIGFVAPPEAIQSARTASLQDAVKDAQNQADAVLSVLNLRAQSIRTIQVNGTSDPAPLPMSRAIYAAEAKASTPVIGGEQRVQTTVTLEISY